MDEEFEERLILWIFYLFLIVTILILVPLRIHNLAEDIAFHEKYIAADVALLEDSVLSAPGDTQVTYSLPSTFKENFQISFNQCKVLVSAAKETEGSLFACNEDKVFTQVPEIFEDTKEILFKKKLVSLTREKV